MSIAQTKANINDIESGKRLSKRDMILNLLTDGLPMTFEQIQKATGFKQATIVGRLSELATDGLVVENPMGNLTYYSPVYADELKNLIKQRKAEERTKRVLKALLNDKDAMNILIDKCFNHSFLMETIELLCVELSDKIKETLKNHTK